MGVGVDVGICVGGGVGTLHATMPQGCSKQPYTSCRSDSVMTHPAAGLSPQMMIGQPGGGSGGNVPPPHPLHTGPGVGAEVGGNVVHGAGVGIAVGLFVGLVVGLAVGAAVTRTHLWALCGGSCGDTCQNPVRQPHR